MFHHFTCDSNVAQMHCFQCFQPESNSAKQPQQQCSKQFPSSYYNAPPQPCPQDSDVEGNRNIRARNHSTHRRNFPQATEDENGRRLKEINAPHVGNSYHGYYSYHQLLQDVQTPNNITQSPAAQTSGFLPLNRTSFDDPSIIPTTNYNSSATSGVMMNGGKRSKDHHVGSAVRGGKQTMPCNLVNLSQGSCGDNTASPATPDSLDSLMGSEADVCHEEDDLQQLSSVGEASHCSLSLDVNSPLSSDLVSSSYGSIR